MEAGQEGKARKGEEIEGKRINRKRKGKARNRGRKKERRKGRDKCVEGEDKGK